MALSPGKPDQQSCQVEYSDRPAKKNEYGVVLNLNKYMPQNLMIIAQATAGLFLQRIELKWSARLFLDSRACRQ